VRKDANSIDIGVSIQSMNWRAIFPESVVSEKERALTAMEYLGKYNHSSDVFCRIVTCYICLRLYLEVYLMRLLRMRKDPAATRLGPLNT
jgi:hypothetical protein